MNPVSFHSQDINVTFFLVCFTLFAVGLFSWKTSDDFVGTKGFCAVIFLGLLPIVS